MPLDGSEQILCIPTADFHLICEGIGWTHPLVTIDGIPITKGGQKFNYVFQGFRPFADPNQASEVLSAILDESRWLPRTAELEADPAWKQVIPYGILTFEGRVFVYRRTKRSSEGRLTGKSSIGIGGHVNPVDCLNHMSPSVGCLEDCLSREFDEEIRYWGHQTRCLGLLNDDSDPVGQVHLGVVYERVATSAATLDGPEIHGLGFWEDAEFEEITERFENWSQILIRHGLRKVLGGEHG